MTETIDWTNITQPTNRNMVLGEAPVNETHAVTFHEVKQTPNGGLVATVESETLEGETLWLVSPRWGNQNGLLSLIKAAQGGENIEGGTYQYTKVESEKSPAGYAHRWTQA